jgi:hypothetical protein
MSDLEIGLVNNQEIEVAYTFYRVQITMAVFTVAIFIAIIIIFSTLPPQIG